VTSGLVQTTKQGWAYVLDRETGEPVWPIEERPVPQSDVPGEQLSPTQPFVTRPAPYEMQGITEDDLIDFTPELRAMALDIVTDSFRLGPLFNPPSLEAGPGGVAIHCPGANGGANIPGGRPPTPRPASSTSPRSAGAVRPGSFPAPTRIPNPTSTG